MAPPDRKTSDSETKVKQTPSSSTSSPSPPSVIYLIRLFVCHATCSVSMVLLNKRIAVGFPYFWTVLLIQNVGTVMLGFCGNCWDTLLKKEDDEDKNGGGGDKSGGKRGEKEGRKDSGGVSNGSNGTATNAETGKSENQDGETHHNDQQIQKFFGVRVPNAMKNRYWVIAQSVLFLSTLYLSIASLYFVSVPLFVVARNTVPAATAFTEVIWTRVVKTVGSSTFKVGSAAVLGLMLTIVGAFVYVSVDLFGEAGRKVKGKGNASSESESPITLGGALFLSLYIMVIAVCSVVDKTSVRILGAEENITPVEVNQMRVALSIPATVLLVLFSDMDLVGAYSAAASDVATGSTTTTGDSSDPSDPSQQTGLTKFLTAVSNMAFSVVFSLLISTVFGFGMGTINLYLQKAVAAASVQVANILYKIVTTLVGLVLFPTTVSWLQWCGYSLSLVGVGLYTFGGEKGLGELVGRCLGLEDVGGGDGGNSEGVGKGIRNGRSGRSGKSTVSWMNMMGLGFFLSLLLSLRQPFFVGREGGVGVDLLYRDGQAFGKADFDTGSGNAVENSNSAENSSLNSILPASPQQDSPPPRRNTTFLPGSGCPKLEIHNLMYKLRKQQIEAKTFPSAPSTRGSGGDLVESLKSLADKEYGPEFENQFLNNQKPCRFLCLRHPYGQNFNRLVGLAGALLWFQKRESPKTTMIALSKDYSTWFREWFNEGSQVGAYSEQDGILLDFDDGAVGNAVFKFVGGDCINSEAVMDGQFMFEFIQKRRQFKEADFTRFVPRREIIDLAVGKMKSYKDSHKDQAPAGGLSGNTRHILVTVHKRWLEGICNQVLLSDYGFCPKDGRESQLNPNVCHYTRETIEENLLKVGVEKVVLENGAKISSIPKEEKLHYTVILLSDGQLEEEDRTFNDVKNSGEATVKDTDTVKTDSFGREVTFRFIKDDSDFKVQSVMGVFSDIHYASPVSTVDLVVGQWRAAVTKGRVERVEKERVEGGEERGIQGGEDGWRGNFGDLIEGSDLDSIRRESRPKECFTEIEYGFGGEK